jgi:hypothetical protein
MHAVQHSTIREGLLTGLIGGLIVAVWFVAFDIGRGEPLSTPNVLGQVFVERDTMPTVGTIMPEAVAEYWLLHFGVFFLLGIGLVALTHLAVRNPVFRMGVWLGLVISFVFFVGYLVLLYALTDNQFPWLPSLVGSLLGIGSMGLYLWRRHPELRRSFRQVPLGGEVPPPSHPPRAPSG